MENKQVTRFEFSKNNIYKKIKIKIRAEGGGWRCDWGELATSGEFNEWARSRQRRRRRRSCLPRR